MLLYWDGRVSRSHVGLTVISVAMLVSKQTMFMLIFQLKIWELPNRSARHAVRTVALLVGVMLIMQGRMAVVGINNPLLTILSCVDQMWWVKQPVSVYQKLTVVLI